MDLRRGSIVTAAPAGSFGKPRPVLVVQAIFTEPRENIAVCFITSDLLRQPGLRVPIAPTSQNGLRIPSEVMVDMVQTVPLGRLGRVVGFMDEATMHEVDAALRLFLGLP